MKKDVIYLMFLWIVLLFENGCNANAIANAWGWFVFFIFGISFVVVKILERKRIEKSEDE